MTEQAAAALDRYALRALVREAGQHLDMAGVASSSTDARLLAEHLLGRALPLLDGAPGSFPDVYWELVERRAAREPLQHILGSMWFRGLELKCAPGVFIVRPETEVVAGAALEALQKIAQERSQGIVRVVDLCTGSGAIAATLAVEAPSARVWAVELADAAYALAGENLARLAPGVRLVQGDATVALPELAELEGACDVVVSNPPYVPAGAVEDTETWQDPELALFGGGADGLAVPRAIVQRAVGLLRPGGVLVMEHDAGQGRALREWALEQGFVPVQTGQDLTGRDRYLFAERAH